MSDRHNRTKTASVGKTASAGTIKYFDYSLLFIIIFLVGFGLVMLYSVSAYEGQSVFNDPTHYLKRQVFSVGLGFIGMFVFTYFPQKWMKKITGLAYILSLLMCLAVFAIGKSSNGSARWLKIGPIQLQPSEISKIAVILTMALLLSKVPKQIKDFKSIIKVLIPAGIMAVAIAINNLSTGIIIAGIAIIMVFVVSPKKKEFAALGVILFGLGLAGIYKTFNYCKRKIKAYQTLQGMYAIGSGGLFGKGLGASVQKLGYVPEAQNDFIFTIICEELGLFGAICVILLFILLIWRCMVIANSAPDLYSSLIAVGVMGHIALQVVLNICVVTNWMPNTGIILPFISYGGTSVAILLSEMGLVLNVSRQIRFDAAHPIE